MYIVLIGLDMPASGYLFDVDALLRSIQLADALPKVAGSFSGGESLLDTSRITREIFD